MSKERDKILAANKGYADAFNKGNLPASPVRRLAILTCMDARLDPLQCAGLSLGDAHIIRNAGGRASDDAIRSLVISYKLLGTNEWFVIHHTDCGMATITNDIMAGLLEGSLQTARYDNGWKDSGAGGGTSEGRNIDWLAFNNEHESVLEDIDRIARNPMVPSSIPIHGFVYDVRSGKLLAAGSKQT